MDDDQRLISLVYRLADVRGDDLAIAKASEQK